MATASKVVIKNYSTEKSFITDVYNGIKGINSNISCDTTVNAQFDNAEIDTPTFNFIMSSSVVLQMKRGAVKATSTNIYIFSVIINGATTATANVTFSQNAVAIDTEIERKIFIGQMVHSTSSSSDGSLLDLFIWIGNYGVSTFDSANILACFITAQFNNVATRFGAGIAGPSIESATFFKAPLSDGEVNIEYTLANLFNYTSEPGFIEYITHISFINAGQEQFRSEYLTNCSTIAQGRSAAIADGIYFSVSPHLLIKLD